MRQVITKYDPSFPIINKDTGLAVDPFRIWMLQVIANGLLIGTGSPSGSLEAQQGTFYMDETGIAGSVLFIKQVADVGGDRTLGWVAVG